MWIFCAASLMCSAWMSVFTPMNSTSLMPASIIRLTAFRPAPPTPTTLITARYAPSSACGARCRRAACSGSGSTKRVTGGWKLGSGRLAGGGGGAESGGGEAAGGRGGGGPADCCGRGGGGGAD